MLTGDVTTALCLVATVSLSAVFLAAGLGKLADRAGTRKAAGEFGAPAWLTAPLALALPVAELVAGVALLFATTRAAGAVGALILLAVFTAAVGISLARGRRPDCHCFGQLHSAPAGWKTLVRNVLLAGLGVVALSGRGPGGLDWVGSLSSVGLLAFGFGVVMAGLIVGGSFAFISLVRSYGRVLLRLDTVESALREAGIDVPEDEVQLPAFGIDPGSPAPAFSTETARGDRVTLEDLLEPALPLLLLFTNPSCGPCQALLPSITRWQAEHRDGLTLATVSSGDLDAILVEAEEHRLERVLVDRDFAVSESYQVSGTPSAVLITADGRIASYLASGSEEIEQLVEQVLTSEEEEPGLRIGAPAPDLALVGLDQEPISLSDPDSDTLVLFWNSGCGFCRSMLADLHDWERSADGSLRLLVIGASDREDLIADAFRSTVVLDPDYAVGNAFGAGGTPMAVLIDRDGRVASRLVGGGDAVLELADDRRGARQVAAGS